MKYYITFGIQTQIEDAIERVQRALGINLVVHESSYRGMYYRSAATGDEHFELQPNYSEANGDWFREAYREYPVLLLVSECTRPHEITVALEKSIPSIRLLEQEEL